MALLCSARVADGDEAADAVVAGVVAGVAAADVGVGAAVDAAAAATAVDDVDARGASYLISAAPESRKIEQAPGQVGEWGVDGMGVTRADIAPRVVGHTKDGHCSAAPSLVGSLGVWEDGQLGRKELLVARSPLASASEPGREDLGACYTLAVELSVPSAVHTRPDA